ncbi:MAG: hypothetical protein VKJ85_00630 [Prochlorothrix sp.]|nr:hypothetical protein [Prochlorothrix sp.]
MNTTHQQILDRLKLLPETLLQEVLHFINLLLSRRPTAPSFAQALRQFRAQIEAEGSDIEEKDFFEDIRDRTPVPVSFE